MAKIVKNKMIHGQHAFTGVKHSEGESFVGLLFRFGEISQNNTLVKPDTKIYVAGDALLVEHEYPEYHKYTPAGRIKRFYTNDSGLLVDFDVYDDNVRQEILSGRMAALSVSWFSDDYDVVVAGDRYVLEFNSIIIYEVSLVSQPAFNTCIAKDENNLACLSPSVNSGGCGCGGKHKQCKCKSKTISVSLDDMIVKHQEVTREEFESLRELVMQAQDAIAVLQKEIEALKEAIQAPPTEVIDELTQAKEKLAQLETTLAEQSTSLESTLKVVERLLNVAEKTYRNLPSLLQR